MQIKLKNLNPNPFNKNKWKVDKEQVEKIKSNLKELGLMGSLPVVKIKAKWHLIYGHHRVMALKEEFGEDYEIDCTEHKYNDEQIFRGYQIENITQKKSDFHTTVYHLQEIKEWLEKTGINILIPEKDKLGRKKHQNISQGIGARQIEKWLNKNGEVISYGTIFEYLRIDEKVAPELRDHLSKKHDKTEEERRDGTINISQANILATIENHKEQKDLAKAMVKSKEVRVREQGKLVTKYKTAPQKVKEAIRKGDVDIISVEELSTIKNPEQQVKTIKRMKELTKVTEKLPTYGKNSDPSLKKKIHNMFTSTSAKIFINLHESKIFMGKTIPKIKESNKLLSALLERPFEDVMKNKDLTTTVQQLKKINDRYAELSIEMQMFSDLIEKFCDRVKNKEVYGI